MYLKHKTKLMLVADILTIETQKYLDFSEITNFGVKKVNNFDMLQLEYTWTSMKHRDVFNFPLKREVKSCNSSQIKWVRLSIYTEHKHDQYWAWAHWAVSQRLKANLYR